MRRVIPFILSLILATIVSAPKAAADDANPYVGRWALTIPGGGAGWLGITKEKGYYDGSILWGGGSVVPLASVYMLDDRLVVTRLREVKRKNAEGKVVRTQTFTEHIFATVDGDTLSLKQRTVRANGNGVVEREFSGTRIPPLPPKPKLKKAKFGKAIQLFDGKSLDGWTLTNPKQANGWYAEDGVLVNNPVTEEGKPHRSFGNLRTVAEFEDFNLTLEVNVDKNGNSGVYLRGIYEVQVMDSYGRSRDPHHMGGVYSRITPNETAEKPAGEWQTMDITLMDRHITVILNGKKIIDNEPLLGCTGGAMTSDEFKAGPLYLQGDHTGVRYRNMVLRPILN